MMISEKSERKLKRAVAWMITWKAFIDAGEDPHACGEIVDEELAKIGMEGDWQKEECLNGRR